MFQLFDGVASRDLTAAQIFTGEKRFLCYICERVIQFIYFCDPASEGLRSGKFVFDFCIVIELSFGHIDRQKLTRSKRSFFAHGCFVHGHHAGL